MILLVCWMGWVVVIKGSRPIQRGTWWCWSVVVGAQVMGIGTHAAFIVVGVLMRGS